MRVQSDAFFVPTHRGPDDVGKSSCPLKTRHPIPSKVYLLYEEKAQNKHKVFDLELVFFKNRKTPMENKINSCK